MGQGLCIPITVSPVPRQSLVQSWHSKGCSLNVQPLRMDKGKLTTTPWFPGLGFWEKERESRPPRAHPALGLSLACPSSPPLSTPPSPMDLLLGSLTLQHQLLVAQLQVSGRQVQLLVHFGVLLIHVPQHVQLLGQVLGEAGGGDGGGESPFGRGLGKMALPGPSSHL